jgi:hypothetical protein
MPYLLEAGDQGEEAELVGRRRHLLQEDRAARREITEAPGPKLRHAPATALGKMGGPANLLRPMISWLHLPGPGSVSRC